jgi:hypothetical protein
MLTKHLEPVAIGAKCCDTRRSSVTGPDKLPRSGTGPVSYRTYGLRVSEPDSILRFAQLLAHRWRRIAHLIYRLLQLAFTDIEMLGPTPHGLFIIEIDFAAIGF